MKIKAFFKECVRVIKILKKPNAQEFSSIVKVTGLGIIIIGVIGFLFVMFKRMIGGL